MTSSNIVKLNVGGTVFQTSRSTLTKYDCMFRAMLESGIPLESDESDSIFIDRDPTHFRYILNFLRDGKIELPENQKEIKEILAEAEFYSIQDLVDLCNNLVEPEVKREKYRVAKSDTELMEIVLAATRDVLIVFYPPFGGGLSINQFMLKTGIHKCREQLDYVFMENQKTKSNWTYKYVKTVAAPYTRFNYLRLPPEFGDNDATLFFMDLNYWLRDLLLE